MTSDSILTPGQRLRALRKARRESQSELARRAHVAIGTVSFAERDGRYPSELVQERLAKALKVERRQIWPEPERKAAVG